MGPPPKPKGVSNSPGKKKKKADGDAPKTNQALNPEDRDIYQEPIKKIVRPTNQVR